MLGAIILAAKRRPRIPMKGDPKPLIDQTSMVCAACDKAIKTEDWVVLGDKRIIHYGGVHGDDCYRQLQGNGA